MTWLPFALAAPMLLTVVNFIDKYLVEHQIPDPRAMPIFGGLIGALAAVLVGLLFGAQPLSAGDAAIVLAAGVLVIAGAVFYFRAVSLEQASTIILIFQVSPLITLVLGWVLLSETIGGLQLIGFFVMLAAVAALSVDRSSGALRLSAAAGLMFIVAFSVAVRSIMIRTLTTDPSFVTLFTYLGLGQGIGAVLLYALAPQYRQAFNVVVRQLGPGVIGLLGLNETLFVVAGSLANQALTLGPAALVNIIGGTATFYGVVFGAVLGALAPHIFKERLGRAELTRKSALALLLFIGLGMIVLGNA